MSVAQLNRVGTTRGVLRGQQIARAAHARRRRIVRMYELQGMTTAEIAHALDLSRDTVRKHLAVVGAQKRRAARTYAPGLVGKRPPWVELRGWGGSCEIVCGRKFCAACGRWRLLVDFGARNDDTLRACCHGCEAARVRWRVARLTPAQRVERLEADRFRYEARRLREGITPRQFRNRRNAVDEIEGTRLPLEPLLDALARLDDSELSNVAARAGVSARALYRYRYGESNSVRIDVADKLAVALGTTSSLIWAEDW